MIDLSAGEERSVAATKTYTASLAAIAALAASGDAALTAEVEGLPAALAGQLALSGGGDDRAERPLSTSGDVTHAVRAAADWDRLTVVGRGAHYATAFEAALKIRELAGIVAEPYSPALRSITCSAASASGELGALVIAAVSAPSPAASATTLTMSGEAPDCETPITTASA